MLKTFNRFKTEDTTK